MVQRGVKNLDKDNEIKYKVNTIIKTNTNNEKELIETFNKKLLKLIISFENNNSSLNCQTQKSQICTVHKKIKVLYYGDKGRRNSL